MSARQCVRLTDQVKALDHQRLPDHPLCDAHIQRTLACWAQEVSFRAAYRMAALSLQAWRSPAGVSWLH